MNLTGIIYIAGMSGLFKVIAQTKNGFVVESLIDQKRMPISSSQRVSSLEDISIFTKGENMPLADVLTKIKENSATLIDTKSDSKTLRSYFKTIVPDYDEEKVYDSDIKKLLTWYSLLKDSPEYWEKKEETLTEGDEKKPITIPKAGEKHFAPIQKEVGKVHSHGGKSSRQVMTQNKGGG